MSCKRNVNWDSEQTDSAGLERMRWIFLGITTYTSPLLSIFGLLPSTEIEEEAQIEDELVDDPIVVEKKLVVCDVLGICCTIKEGYKLGIGGDKSETEVWLNPKDDDDDDDDDEMGKDGGLKRDWVGTIVELVTIEIEEEDDVLVLLLLLVIKGESGTGDEKLEDDEEEEAELLLDMKDVREKP